MRDPRESGTCALLKIDRAKAADVVRHSLAEVGREWGRPEFGDLAPEADIFEMIDSFGVVELLLQTEGDLETVVGRYVPLADEQVLDAEKSPLRSLDRWIDHVTAAANG